MTNWNPVPASLTSWTLHNIVWQLRVSPIKIAKKRRIDLAKPETVKDENGLVRTIDVAMVLWDVTGNGAYMLFAVACDGLRPLLLRKKLLSLDAPGLREGWSYKSSINTERYRWLYKILQQRSNIVSVSYS